MNIDWKARFKNKAFWIATVSTVVLLTQQLGLNIFPDNWSAILNSILALLSFGGIIVDTSTSGISDVVKTDETIETKTEE